MELPYSNLRVEHWNPGASLPLIMPVNLVCNVADELIYGNIKANAAREWPRLSASEAHEGVAVLVGSGPSLAESIDAIRRWKDQGASIFAMNNAANYLAERGVVADFQVMIDARPETAALIGPARMHLLSSQCAPETLAAAAALPGSQVIIWHLALERLDEFLPADEPAHVLIGGSASVGNTATCLAYAMGYRQLEIYGYDSSARGGVTHAKHQAMNDGEPMAEVWYRGTTYLVSLTMKLQAEKFQETARDLIKAGCTINVHGDGLLPAMWNAPKGVLSEVEKYRAMWSFDGYRAVAPGEQRVDEFLSVVNVPANAIVVDFGCGTGRGALALAGRGYNPILVDFADNCRDEAARALPFICADLSSGPLAVGDVGYCTDVMEHIPDGQVDAVIRNIMAHVPLCYFAIDFRDDICGAIIGETLHMSVHPHEWWMEKFTALGFRVEWSRSGQDAGAFVVTH